MQQSQETWVIVLAGGEGTRLAPLTRALYGHDLPKQFAVLAGERSLLQETIARALALAAEEHVVVVVTTAREDLARAQLAAYPKLHVLAQPASRETAPAILLGLAHVRHHAPDANVVVLPADHHVPNPAPILGALTTLAAHEATRSRVTMIGVVPDDHEIEYGFVVPGETLGALGSAIVRSVRKFHEKPTIEAAQRLESEGAVYNTFITAGTVDAFFRMARAVAPTLVEAFELYSAWIGTPGEARARDRLYTCLRSVNFSKEVLEHAPELAVVAVEGTGWTDWGSPRRVFQSLAATGQLRHLLDRMQHTSPNEWLVPLLSVA